MRWVKHLLLWRQALILPFAVIETWTKLLVLLQQPVLSLIINGSARRFQNCTSLLGGGGGREERRYQTPYDSYGWRVWIFSIVDVMHQE